MNFPPDSPSAAAPPVDMHVHLVGNGTGGTGCELRARQWRWPLDVFMLNHVGLPPSALKGDLDRLYLDRLLHFVQRSSLGGVILLPHERPYDAQGRVLERHCSLYVPNDYVLRVARRHPVFLPAVSIHPARPDALDELERCIEAGAVIMKCLPNSQNIDGNDPRYRPFWERIAAAGLPLLAHTGGEHTVPVIRPDLTGPQVLEGPLRCGVTVIAAHSAAKSGPFEPEHFDRLVEMMGRHPRLYGDLSAFNLPIRVRRVRSILAGPMAGRFLHGSDFPVPVYGHWAWMRGLVDWSTFRKWENHPNPIERDFQLKKAMGFPMETFTRIWSLLRRPARTEVNLSPGN